MSVQGQSFLIFSISLALSWYWTFQIQERNFNISESMYVDVKVEMAESLLRS